MFWFIDRDVNIFFLLVNCQDSGRRSLDGSFYQVINKYLHATWLTITISRNGVDLTNCFLSISCIEIILKTVGFLPNIDFVYPFFYSYIQKSSSSCYTPVLEQVIDYSLGLWSVFLTFYTRQELLFVILECVIIVKELTI